jgi:hypothetical protein
VAGPGASAARGNLADWGPSEGGSGGVHGHGPWLRPGPAAYVWYVIVTAVFDPDGLRFLATIVPAAPLKTPVPPVTVP